MPANNFTDSNTLTGWLKQLGIAALYALLIYVGELYFNSDIVVGYFEPASGLALAALLLGGKRYALGLLLGATLVRTISEDSLWEAAIISLVDTLQALCGAWLLTRDGKFDSRLQSLRDYLRLILLGGCASIAIGTLAVNTTLLFSGLLIPESYFHGLIQWWMSDTLGVILITPLILVWWSERDNRREAGKIAETVLLFGLTILAGQAIFLDWWHDAIGPVAQSYWMFLIATWAAVRFGIRETVIVLLMTAVYALLGAIWGVGFFADDIIQSQLVNYWLYMLTLSVVGMSLATYFSERKQMEEKLRLTQFVSDHAPDCIFWVDKQARICYVNEAVCRGLGYTKEELLTMSVPDIDPDFPAAVWLDHWQKLQQKNTLTFETRHRRKDGFIFPVEASANFVKFGDKEFNVAFTRDITEFKQANEELLIQQQRLNIIIESSQDLIFLKDLQSRYIIANKAHEQLFGKAAQDFIGKTDFELMPEDAARLCQESDALALQSQGFVRKEERVQNKWFDTAKQAILDAGGNVTGIVGIIRDITERKQAEEELRIAAATFETQDVIVITDAHGVIQRVNNAFTEMTGYTAEEAVGQTPKLFSSERHDAAFYKVMWESIQHTGAWQGEIWNRRKNGEVYPARLSITAVKGDKGEITHYVAVKHDITKRKQAEEQIQSLAFYDALTQLPNRRLLDDRLRQVIALSKRNGCYSAVMFLDLDNFKTLNDTHGHEMGDLLLIEVAHRITRCVRKVDTVARFGGDEFVVVLSELNKDKAESDARARIIAEKIRVALDKPYALKIQHEGKAETIVEHHSAASIGVVLFINHETSTENLLKHADTAMYQAKNAGRNQFRIYEPEV